MYLFLDNSEEEKIFFYIISRSGKEKKFVFKDVKAHRGLLACFDELLKKKFFNLKNIEGLGVRTGVGRFTASRIAVTFANTLSYVLKKPIVGLIDYDSKMFLKKIKKTKKGAYLSAKYSGQANVGSNKKL
ncbi:MAG TPA: hypothetical protein P5230_01155 [Candidatus Magasanikbacteria bacterium]|nr:hypothetical protein [Candidatus Magasanikbacteria bacterium]